MYSSEKGSIERYRKAFNSVTPLLHDRAVVSVTCVQARYNQTSKVTERYKVSLSTAFATIPRSKGLGIIILISTRRPHMDFLKVIGSLFGEQSNRPSNRNGENDGVIRCASCHSAEIQREDMEHLRCNRCGKLYTLDEARKKMGTTFCQNCIYHEVNLFDPGIMERCGIWGLGKCRAKCNRKATKPQYRWTDANRWE